MIEKIFIPTVNRSDNQITYNFLPEELQKKVVFVVQAHEKDLYTDYSNADIMVLPDTPEFHFSDYYCLARTRLEIYKAGRNMKYAILDDDLQFGRRNAKYYGGEDNMEGSKRKSTEADILEMFELYDSWLDEESVTVCGCSHVENPPGGEQYRNNASLGSGLWINGSDFTDILDTLELTRVRVMEDTCFLLTLLTRGYGNRVSEEFIFYNNSVLKKDLASTVWDEQTFEQTHNDHKIMQSMFPGIFTILYDENGERVKGGFRNYGKVKVEWSKAYKSKSKYHLSTIHNTDLFEF